MNLVSHPLYDHIIARANNETPIRQCCFGLTWTYCRTEQGIGFAQSPGTATRTLPFPGTLQGARTAMVAGQLRSWDPYQATVGLAAANAAINAPNNSLMAAAQPLVHEAAANLAVFAHFRPQLVDRKVVVVGRYPGMDAVFAGLDVTVLERSPGEGDLPDPAAEYVIPQADWVFITATSLINKTFPRLSNLAFDAVTVLMGPSTPWLEVFADYGVDYLAGVVPIDIDRAAQIAAEGGGTRLFGKAVNYAVVALK